MAGVTTRATAGVPLTATNHDDNLEAMITLHKGTAEPSPTYGGMLWLDTSNSLVKQRTVADDGWNTLGSTDSVFSFVPTKDEDDMSSDSATHLATQQSIKAYVDTQVSSSDELVEDTSPQLGGNLDFNGNTVHGVDSTEMAILDGATVTTAELNILDGVTSTAAELNILDGVTSTAAELNILDGVTSTAAELNLLDGVTSTTAELNLVDGITRIVDSTSATGSAKLPAGTTAQRDGTPSAGYLRWNTTDTSAEVYDGSAWAAVGGDLSFGGDTFGADKTIGSNDNYALSFETNATERLKLTNDGRGLSQFTAKVWCRFNGTGSISINDSHNVSSLSDLETGKNRVNFSNSLVNSDYACSVTAWVNYAGNSGIDDPATSMVTCIASNGSSYTDSSRTNLIVFGD